MESWKTITGYENYMVSNNGRIKSINYANTGQEHILNLIVNKDGYIRVKLYNKNKSRNFFAHVLVGIEFLGYDPYNNDGLVIDHDDCDKTNNKKENLKIVTVRYNNSKERKSLSGYTGVHNKSGKWIASIVINGERIYLGSSNDPEKMSELYQSALSNISKYNGNPKDFRKFLGYTDHEDRKEYKGVFFNNDRKKWKVKLVLDGKRKDIGRYDSKSIAIKVSKAVINNITEYGGDLPQFRKFIYDKIGYKN